MAFRKKNKAILKYRPDILIVAECENETKLKFGELTPIPNDFYWFGDNEHKGIGIFSYSDFGLKLFKNYNPEFRYVIPLTVKGENNFNLFAIWAMNNKESPHARYIAQVWLAINYYIFDNDSIFIGDFNSNKIWDNESPRKYGNHSEVHNYLRVRNIHSLYHLKTNEELGNEKTPTLFLHRDIKKPYHIDYCYASNRLFSKGFNLSVGEPDDWIKLSDHVPIIAEFE